MNPRVKEAILWGVVGFLTFLVLLQGYELLQDVRVELAVKAGAALVVFLASTVITYVAGGRVATPVEETDETVADDAATVDTAGEHDTPEADRTDENDDTMGDDGLADENDDTDGDDRTAEEDDEGTHRDDAQTRDENEP